METYKDLALGDKVFLYSTKHDKIIHGFITKFDDMNGKWFHPVIVATDGVEEYIATEKHVRKYDEDLAWLVGEMERYMQLEVLFPNS